MVPTSLDARAKLLMDDLGPGRDPAARRYRPLGAGPEVAQHLRQLAAEARLSVWNAQPFLGPPSSLAALESNRVSAARGLDLRMVTTRMTLRAYPLIAAFPYPLRVGEVAQQILIVDRNLVVLPGPPDTLGDSTAWSTTDAQVVRPFVDLWQDIWDAARPVPALPLTQRQVEMVLALADGATDHALARRFEISPRTVANDLARAAEVFGVSGRTALVGAALGFRGAR